VIDKSALVNCMLDHSGYASKRHLPERLGSTDLKKLRTTVSSTWNDFELRDIFCFGDTLFYGLVELLVSEFYPSELAAVLLCQCVIDTDAPVGALVLFELVVLLEEVCQESNQLIVLQLLFLAEDTLPLNSFPDRLICKEDRANVSEGGL
jgi:hypothetical protein